MLRPEETECRVLFWLQVCPAAPSGRGTDDFVDWRRHPVTTTKNKVKKTYLTAKTRLSRTTDDLPPSLSENINSKRRLASTMTRGMAKAKNRLTPSCLAWPRTV